MNNRSQRRILITGGAGFIGSHVVRHFVNNYPGDAVINLDALTYAGNLESLADVEGKPNYKFVKGDITDKAFIDSVFEKEQIDSVIHLAAESHVDRSIQDPLIFVKVNVLGTANLLNAARRSWKEGKDHLFYHVSTDEVYGSLGDEGYFTETTPYDPRSPYSASKAGSDHLVRSYHHTFGLPVVISNCSNNYGPYQFPEKLIPLTINNILNKKDIPVYGKGENVRDWLWVEDHVRAIDTIFHKGVSGATYNVGGGNEWKNIDLVRTLCDVIDEIKGNTSGKSQDLITFVKDRAGHDHRYAIDFSKLKDETGWEPLTDFKQGLKDTAQWYIKNKLWVDHVTSGEYLNYYEEQYLKR